MTLTFAEPEIQPMDLFPSTGSTQFPLQSRDKHVSGDKNSARGSSRGAHRLKCACLWASARNILETSTSPGVPPAPLNSACTAFLQLSPKQSTSTTLSSLLHHGHSSGYLIPSRHGEHNWWGIFHPLLRYQPKKKQVNFNWSSTWHQQHESQDQLLQWWEGVLARCVLGQRSLSTSCIKDPWSGKRMEMGLSDPCLCSDHDNHLTVLSFRLPPYQKDKANMLKSSPELTRRPWEDRTVNYSYFAGSILLY